MKVEGFRAKAGAGAKKSFLADSHVKSIIGEMQQKTDKCVDRLRLQQYYDLTANDFATLQHNTGGTPSQLHDPEDEERIMTILQNEPNKFISPSIINNRLNRLKRLEELNAQGVEYLDGQLNIVALDGGA